MSAINTTTRPVRIRIDWTQRDNISKTRVGKATGTVVSLCGFHFAYVYADGRYVLSQKRCRSKLAAKRLVGRVIREKCLS